MYVRLNAHELQEHAGSLTKAYTDHAQKAREALRRTSLRYPPPKVNWYV
jgi:hypothetical protein